MKFQKGDIVEIISSQCIPEMQKMIGFTKIIKDLYYETEETEWYMLDDDCYIWNANWLQQVKNFEVNENELDRIFGEQT